MRSRASAITTIFVLPLLAGLAAASCVDAPNDPVMFSCEPTGRDTCPDGYSCAPDGCCHRDDTDPDDNPGACRIGGAGPGTAGDGAAADATGAPTVDETGSGTTAGDTEGATGGS